METIIFLGPPVAIGILLAVILGYYGNHILSRGIIFIDIAVAQIAALGTMIGLLLGFADSSMGLQLVSYLFTVLIIGLFAYTKFDKQRIPQEAYIGIIYCIGLGLALLLAERIPGGSNYISKTITGNILWTTWKDVLVSGILFSLIGIYLAIFHRKFRNVSLHEGQAINLRSSRMYDLLFYVSFGIVIVKAVPIGGVFLVFILLIAPAASITLFTSNWKKRVWGAWIIGIVGTTAGIYSSHFLNISNGPAIVCLLGSTAVILTIWVVLNKPRTKTQEEA